MDIAERIRTEVEGWDGVTSRPHRFGGVAFMLGKRELGHIHGDRLAPALGLCRALGPGAAPDCAQGAYHDHWFAALGAIFPSCLEKFVIRVML